MNLKRFLWIGSVVVLITACGGPKVLTSLKDNASDFETSGNYVQAMAVWEQYFNQTSVDETSGVDFANAAKTAFKVSDPIKAKAWFDQARYKNYSDAEMYATLAKIYNSENNLSKELSALEYYNENFGSTNAEVNSRLFSIYSEIDSNDQALLMWSKLGAELKNTEPNLSDYLKVNKALENDAVCDSAALAILNINSENIAALEWNAKKYYWIGQNRYKQEMDKYNQNKTRKNYSILLKQLELVTSDFKKALPYLNKLWKLDPGTEYAAYLANIYALFGDETKTSYYKNYRK
jgi:tetratricopeptide (TPR) repeat protein